MELSVWVEGTLRVVCGLSSDTCCQEVVIALAQDIGQTGRYVLSLRLHGTEKQLLKDDCPLKVLSSLGKHGRDACFILHRTGPSVTPASPRIRHLNRTHTPDLHPPKLTDLQHERHGTFPRRAKNKSQNPVVSMKKDVPSMEKEAVFVKLTQQSRAMQELEKDLDAVERLTRDSEKDYGLDRDLRDLREELETLEERQRQNEEELRQEQHWREEMEKETDRAQDLSYRLEQLKWSVHHQSQRMDQLMSRTESLQTDVQTQTDQALRPLEQELHQRHHQAERITAALEEAERQIQHTDNTVKMQRKLLAELSKDLRQCNLQQFIKQASGSAPSDLTNHLPPSDLYLSTAGILE